VDGYSSGFRSAENELSTGLMVPEVHIIKNQINKLTEATQLLIGIRGAWGGVGGGFANTLHQTMAASFCALSNL